MDDSEKIQAYFLVLWSKMFYFSDFIFTYIQDFYVNSLKGAHTFLNCRALA
jgi:hypothetical protein